MSMTRLRMTGGQSPLSRPRGGRVSTTPPRRAVCGNKEKADKGRDRSLPAWCPSSFLPRTEREGGRKREREREGGGGGGRGLGRERARDAVRERERGGGGREGEGGD